MLLLCTNEFDLLVVFFYFYFFDVNLCPLMLCWLMLIIFLVLVPSVILLGTSLRARYQGYSIGMKCFSTCKCIFTKWLVLLGSLFIFFCTWHFFFPWFTLLSNFMYAHIRLLSFQLSVSLIWIIFFHVIRGLRGNSLSGTLSPDLCQLTGLWYLWVIEVLCYHCLSIISFPTCRLVLTLKFPWYYFQWC